MVKRLLEKCGEYVTTKQSSLTQWHPVLGWFSRPLDQHLNESLAVVKSQLQLLWSGPIVRVMFAALTKLVKEQVRQISIVVAPHRQGCIPFLPTIIDIPQFYYSSVPNIAIFH